MVLTIKRRDVIEQLDIVSLSQTGDGIVFKRDWDFDEESICFDDVKYVILDGKFLYRKQKPLLDKQIKRDSVGAIRDDCYMVCPYCEGRGKVRFLWRTKLCPVCKGLGVVLDDNLFFERVVSLFESF